MILALVGLAKNIKNVVAKSGGDKMTIATLERRNVSDSKKSRRRHKKINAEKENSTKKQLTKVVRFTNRGMPTFDWF